MKKISLLIISTFFGLITEAQVIPVKSIVDIKLQKGTEKITSEKAQPTLKKNKAFNINETKGEFYKIDNFILRLIPFNSNVSRQYLEDKQKGLYELFKLSPPRNYKSTIKSISNFKVLVVQYDRDSLSHYDFYCVSNDNKKQLNGVVKSSLSAKNQMAGKLDDFLKTMHFKK